MDTIKHIDEVANQRKKLGNNPLKNDIRASVLEMKERGLDRYDIIQALVITILGEDEYNEDLIEKLNDILADEFSDFGSVPDEEEIRRDIQRLHNKGCDKNRTNGR